MEKETGQDYCVKTVIHNKHTIHLVRSTIQISLKYEVAANNSCNHFTITKSRVM